MRIGKYVTNPGVIGAAFGAVSTNKRAQSMRKDWRRYLIWGLWLLGLALAVGSVAMEEQDREFEEERKQAKAQARKKRA